MRAMRAVALLVSFLLACQSSATPVEPKPAPAATPSQPASPAPVASAQPAKATYPGVPDTIAGEHLAWILTAIAHDGVVTRAEVDKRLHAKFLAAVPADKFIEVSKSLVAFNPVEVTAIVKSTELDLVAKIKTKEGPLLAIVNVDGPTKQVIGLLFKPDAGTLFPYTTLFRSRKSVV